MKRIKQVLFAAAILVFPLLIFAGGGKKAGFKEAVHKSLDSSEEIIKAVSAVREAEATVEKTYGQFDLFFKGGASYLESDTEADSPFSPEETDVFSYNASLSNKLFTGGTLSLQLEYSKTILGYPDAELGFPMDTSLFTPEYNPAFEPSFSFVYVQPLLKDFWGRPDQKAVKAGEYSVKMAKAGLKSSVLDIISKLKESYFLIYMSEKMVKIQKNFYEDARKFYNRSVELEKIGLREEKDVYQTKASMLNSKAEIAPAENRLKTAKENFFKMAGYPAEKWDEIEISVTGDIEKPYIPGDLTENLEATLIDVQPAVVMAKLGVDMARIGREISENLSLPSLNVTGSYGLEGTGAGVEEGYEKMSSNDYNNFMIGLDLSYAFPNRAASGEMKEKKEKLLQAKEKYEAARKGMKIAVRSSYRQLLTAKGDYELKKEAKNLQKKRLEIEEKNFNQGRISTQQLLMAQTDYHTARIKEISAFYAYAKAVNSWNRVTGRYDKYYNEYINKGD